MVLSAAPRLLAVCLAAVAALALVAPRNSWFVLPSAVVWTTTVLGLLVVAALRGPVLGRCDQLVRSRPRGAVAAGALVGGTLAAAHAWLAFVPFGWDARGTFDGAERIAEGAAFTETDWEYFARYPNNIPLALAESGIIDAGAAVGLSPVVAVVAAQVAGFVVLLWCLGSMLVMLDRHAAVLPVQGLATLLLGLNAGLAVPYSDFPAATLVAVALWAAVRGWSGRPAWWLLALVAMVLAMGIKIYTVALAVGLLALVPALARQLGRLQAALVVVAVGVSLAVGVVAVHDVARRATGLTDDQLVRYDPGVPALHFLALGTYDSQEDSATRRYGGWSAEHIADTRAVKDPVAREQMLRAKVVAQVSERRVLGNIEFFAKKVGWTWGDGTFWAHGEGPDKTQGARLPGAAGQLQLWFIGSGEPYRRWTAGVVQGVWILTLLTTAVVACRRHRDPWVRVGAMALLALAGYLMLFESRPRYLVALLPVLLLVAGLGRARVGARSPRAGLVRRERTAPNTPMPEAQ